MGKYVHTKRVFKSIHLIKCVERVFSSKCSLFCVYWGYQNGIWNLRTDLTDQAVGPNGSIRIGIQIPYQNVWKMCGKGIIFIDTFHTVRVLSNFAGRAGYATFPARHPLGTQMHNSIKDTKDVKSVRSHQISVSGLQKAQLLKYRFFHP